MLASAKRGVEIRTGLYRHSNQSLFAAANSTGKGLVEARDRGGNSGDMSRFRAAETSLSRVSGRKAAESQRLFRRRQETGVAQECVVELAGLKPTNIRLCIFDREAPTWGQIAAPSSMGRL